MSRRLHIHSLAMTALIGMAFVPNHGFAAVVLTPVHLPINVASIRPFQPTPLPIGPARPVNPVSRNAPIGGGTGSRFRAFNANQYPDGGYTGGGATTGKKSNNSGNAGWPRSPGQQWLTNFLNQVIPGGGIDVQ
jgi:hypothetical protein